jgi:hypothetical protein
MFLRDLTLIVSLVLLLGGGDAPTVEIRSLAEGEASPPATVTDLAWLEGRWVGEGLGGQAEEIYGAPAGERIMGMFGSVRDGKAEFFEFILIEERSGSLVYRLKHFGADFSPWEAADETVDFPLVAMDADAAYFDGLTLKRTGEGKMVSAVRVKLEDGLSQFEFHYEKAHD